MTVQLRLWTGFGITLVFLLVIAAVGHYESKRVSISEQKIIHTYQDLVTLETVISELKDAETGQRGYLLTSDELYLQPYYFALKILPDLLQELMFLIADNPRQQQSLIELNTLVDQKLAKLDQTIVTQRLGKTEAALAMIRTSQGRTIMDQIRSVVKQMRQEEERLLKIRIIDSKNKAKSATLITYGVSFSIFIIGVLIAFLTSKSISDDYIRLQSAEASLAMANQELQNFVYRTSHDFKSPLLGIISMTTFIKEDLESGSIDEVLDNVARIRKNADALTAVVSSTLQLAKTDLSDNHVETVHLNALLIDIYARLDALAKQHKVELRVGDGIKTNTINSDPNHLMTALENIISNAIKYADGNRQQSFVAIDAALDINGSVHITISDNGVGIPEKRHSEVFQMFKQFHPERANGSGLGMYIIKKSVRRIGGVISFDSTPKGTNFHLRIPHLAATPHLATAQEPT